MTSPMEVRGKNRFMSGLAPQAPSRRFLLDVLDVSMREAWKLSAGVDIRRWGERVHVGRRAFDAKCDPWSRLFERYKMR